MTTTMDSFEAWRPSDPSGACIKFVTSEAGHIYENKPYEEFLCLYPFLKPFYMGWEMKWRPYWLYYWMEDNPHIPVLACILYGIMIFGGQKYFSKREPWNFRTSLMLWNLGLSIFSLIGFMRLLPVNVHIIRNFTWKENLCFDPVSHTGHNEAGIWVFFFSLSKFAELLDTFFIVVHKKPLILLHWYHHMSVLLYCWFYLVYTAPAGIFFANMNYGVHTVMYFYYFLMAARCRPKWFKPKFITVIQIVQMVVGAAVTCLGIIAYLSEPKTCHTNIHNIIPSLTIFASYFVLFMKFFLERYYWKTSHKTIKVQKKLA